MKHFSDFSTVRIKAALVLLIAAPWVGLAQEQLPYLVGTGTQLELVGFPVHSPALDSGPVTSVAGTIVSWTPSFRDRPFGSALPQGQECYAEVVGPLGHPWLGQRFELDETATRARTDHGLVAAPSALNTRGLPNSVLVGGQLQIRQHLTLGALWGETVRNRITFGAEKATTFSFLLPAPGTPTGTRSVRPSPFQPSGAMEWVDSLSPSLRFTHPLLIPPGTCVGVTFGEQRGSSLAFTGERRSWPTAVPLQAGANLLSYPYPQDLRLGVDWGSSREGFRGLARPSLSQERIELVSGNLRRSFSPELQANGGIRWRLLSPIFGTARWVNPASYLDTIPVGQGFILRKNKADPNHVFYPPKP